MFCMPGLQLASSFQKPIAMPVCRLQTKEVTRLNHVYLKLLRDAGVEVIGEPPPCLTVLADQQAFRAQCKASLGCPF